MAQSYFRGTKNAIPLISKHTDILSEKIMVGIGEDFTMDDFFIEYHISTDTTGKQIPMLFVALDVADKFQVWVDDSEVQVEKLSDSTICSAFKPDIRKMDEKGEGAWMRWMDTSSEEFYYFKDRRSFNINLKKGEHTIRVTYKATPSFYINDWIRRYHLDYSLEPARHWKSFGSLEIAVTNRFHLPIETTLGKPNNGDGQTFLIWDYKGLPASAFSITYAPHVSFLASILMAIGPLGLSLIFSGFLIFFHWRSIKRHRMKLKKGRPPYLTMGSIFIPLLALLAFLFSYNLIDAVIGDEATNFHGYTFFAVLLYPIIMPVYWFIMVCVNAYYKGRYE
jgi:hypothetical protein